MRGIKARTVRINAEAEGLEHGRRKPADYFLNFRDPAMRKLTYHFSDLSGVIFGINTPTEAKLEICKIIEEKCRTENRTDFKFYQAFYSRSTSTIEHAEVGLLKFNI
jgi:hypothetical protein